ncbi:MAG TPA: LacI family DNA-binding transcriptional regulator [Spirochaetia bacterium]|nr:LacI family DNA-binding transcriptional regulator [Spirochaetia bacterium]
MAAKGRSRSRKRPAGSTGGKTRRARRDGARARPGRPADRLRAIDSVEIARLVGVARSTVSKALNGYPYVAAETRERILEAVRDYEYYPNYSAQVLAGKQPKTLGLFFFNPGHFSEDVLADFMISSVIENAASLGYRTLAYVIRDPDERGARESLKEAFYQRRIAAGVFIGARNREPLIERLVADGQVVGVFDQRPPSRAEPNRVVTNFDDVETARAVIDYLVSRGHRRIGVIHGDRTRNAGAMKQRGFLAGLKAHRLEAPGAWMMDGDFQSEGGYRAMRQLIAAEKELPTAIAAVNDNTAFGAMRAIAEVGLHIPEDISIVGIDGHPFGPYARPPLTTFEYDFQAMMRGLISSVIGVVTGQSDGVALRQVHTSRLVERESCRRIDPA